MFTCIACSKPEDGGDDEGGVRGSGTPSTKEAVKSLTAQVLNPTPSLSLSLSLLLVPKVKSRVPEHRSRYDV